MFGTGGRSLGIDIGDRALKLVQLRGGGGKMQVSAWSLLDKNSPSIQGEKWRADLFEDIKLALQVNGIKGGWVSVALPDTLVNISYRKVPPMPKEELANALKWEAGKDTPFSIDDMILDYISLGQAVEGNNPMNAYLVAIARKKVVEDLCTKLNDLRIKVRSVEFSTMAQMSCHLRSSDLSGITAMVDLGEQQTSLVVLKDEQVRFFRTINMGGQYVTDAISQATGLNWWEADKLKESGIRATVGADEEISRALRGSLENIVDEVFQTFHFYGADRREGVVEKVVITGGGALMPGIGGFFQEILGIPTNVIDPFIACPPSRGLRDRDALIAKGPRLVTALGLAMTE